MQDITSQQHSINHGHWMCRQGVLQRLASVHVPSRERARRTGTRPRKRAAFLEPLHLRFERFFFRRGLGHQDRKTINMPPRCAWYIIAEMTATALRNARSPGPSRQRGRHAYAFYE